MVEIFDCYMRQRLVDVALKRRHVKAVNVGKVSLDSVELLGSGKYQVKSQSDPTQTYEVDLTIGMCSWTQGETGAICKHQTACAEHSMTVVPQMFLLNNKNRHWLAVLAVGIEKAPNETFFLNLRETDSEELGEVVIEKEEVIEDIVMETTFENVREIVSDENGAAVAKAHEATEAILNATVRFGNSDTVIALNKILQRISSVHSAYQLNSALHCIGTAVKSDGAGHGKIPCQPTSVARRPTGRPRGAAPLSKGRRPRGSSASASQPTRPRTLSHNISNNVANAKSHGSGH